ncbi:MAG: hypothetical protein JOZ43_00785 [Acidobacteriales bacterium]|nr:hypothetical protein [Terriglobales bacterium]
MTLHDAITAAANFALITALIVYGFRLFAEYHSRGKWAKNITSLLAGLGLFALASSQLLSPRTAEILVVLSHSKIPAALIWLSDGLLLAAIASFGIITYTKPLRLWHERKIERDLHRELPKIS